MDYIKERKEAFRKYAFYYTYGFNPCCDGLYKRTLDVIRALGMGGEFQSLL